jgi:hypothetical protein
MSSQVLTNSKVYCAGYNWSGDLNSIALRYAAELKDSTNFGSGGTRERKPGLIDFSAAIEGFWNGAVGGVDAALQSQVGVADNVITICPQTGAEAEPGYFGRVIVASYVPGAKIGDMLAFSAEAQGSKSPLCRGTIGLNATKGTTGTGTIMNLGAVGATQKVYAALHVYPTVSGTLPTLDVIVQSAALVGFGSPTDRITFTQASAEGGQWGTPVSGPITDAYWRVKYTLGGTLPSFPFIVTIAIQ